MDLAAHLRWIDDELESLTALLVRWAEIPSGSDDPEGLGRMAGEVRRALEALGARAEFVDLSGANGPAIRASKRPEAPVRVLLGGHLDTVYGLGHPFRKTSRLDERRLGGPGVADMKGGLVVLLHALEGLERSPWAERIGWEVLVNPDEEIGSPGSRELFAQSAARCRLGLLFEPALPDGALVGSRKGAGTFTAVVRGRTAHAGRNPEEGRNAIVALARLVLRVQEFGQGGVVVNPGQIEGGTAPNVVPDRASCRFNLRVDTSDEQARAEGGLAEAAAEASSQDGISVELAGGFSRPPKPLEPRTEALLGQLRSCGQELGLALSWRPSGGASDGNLLAAAGLPTVDSLGPVGGELHSEREFVLLDSLIERAKLSGLFLLKLAAGEFGEVG